MFQGYTTWNPRQDELTQCFKESIQRRQSAHTVTIRPTTNRNRFALTQLQLNRLAEEIAWHKDCADDGILLQQFVSTQIQTLKRPGHLLDTCRVNVKLTNQRRLASVFGIVQYFQIGTAGAFLKLRSDVDIFGYEIGTFKPSSLDPHAAHGARLIQDYLRMSDLASSDGSVEGLAELISTCSTGKHVCLLASATTILIKCADISGFHCSQCSSS